MIITEEAIRRIEISEAERVRDSANAFGGDVLEICGGVAAFCGEGNVMTQCVAIGHGKAIGREEFELILAHYRGRCDEFEFKLSPISIEDLRKWVVVRAVALPEFETVLVRSLAEFEPIEGVADIRSVPREEMQAYAERSAFRFYGGSPPPGLVEVITAACQSETVRPYEVYVDGIPAAGCALGISGRIGWLSGAAVLPEYRGRGLHKAMQMHRMSIAKDLGLELICQGAMPGSISQQNAQKQGFEIAFTRPTFMVRP